MNLETVLGISVLAIAAIAYVVSHLPKSNRMKFVDQKVKDCGKTAYTVVLFI